MFEYGTFLRPMQGAGFVEGQSAACSVCPAGGLRARWSDNQWINNGPFPRGCGGGDEYALTPGNIQITGASGITFTNCTFQRLGAAGCSAGGGSQNCSWSGNIFKDISAGALVLGEVTDCAEANVSKWNKNLTVTDNRIFDTGVEYTGAASLFLGYVSSTTVAHNRVSNSSYSSLSMGWGWYVCAIHLPPPGVTYIDN